MWYVWGVITALLITSGITLINNPLLFLHKSQREFLDCSFRRQQRQRGHVVVVAAAAAQVVILAGDVSCLQSSNGGD